MDKQTWRVVSTCDKTTNDELIINGEYDYRCLIPSCFTDAAESYIYYNKQSELYSAVMSTVILRRGNIENLADLRASRNIHSGMLVYDHEYIDTGGNCMVSVFKLWDPKENVTRFLLANESGCSINTVDYITSEIEFEDSMVLLNADSGYFDPELVEYDLLRYCWFAFLKAEHEYFGTTTDVHFGMLEGRHYLDSDLMDSITIVDREGNDYARL